MSALERAGQTHRETLTDKGMVLPGVVELITALSHRTGTVQTVVAGNVCPNAEVKLGALGLRQFFDLDIGRYGSDHPDRYRLVQVARQRASEKYGPAYGSLGSAVVIGDTPRDVEAAQLGGAGLLAVASGVHGADELLAAGAPRVFDDLTPTVEVLAYLFSA